MEKCGGILSLKGEQEIIVCCNKNYLNLRDHVKLF